MSSGGHAGSIAPQTGSARPFSSDAATPTPTAASGWTHRGPRRSDSSKELYVLTTAPGFGVGWAKLNPDAEQPAAEIRLRTEQLIRGKLVDLSGQPAAGVELRVYGFGEARNLGRWAETSLHDVAPKEASAWPLPLKTDDHGRFVFHGVGRGLFVSFVVHDLRFAQQWLGVPTDDREGAKEVTLALEPAKIIAGRVLASDTRQPIPSAAIEVGADTESGTHPARFRADAHGRFRANPYPADHFTVDCLPPRWPALFAFESRDSRGPRAPSRNSSTSSYPAAL